MSPNGSYPDKLFFYEKGRKGKKIWKSVVPNPLLPFVIVSVVDTWYKRINMLYCSHYTSFCYQMAMIQMLTYPDLSPRWWDVTDYSLSLPFATLSPPTKTHQISSWIHISVKHGYITWRLDRYLLSIFSPISSPDQIAGCSSSVSVCLFVCIHICIFISFSSTTGPISAKFATNHCGWREFKFVQLKVYALSKGIK